MELISILEIIIDNCLHLKKRAQGITPEEKELLKCKNVPFNQNPKEYCINILRSFDEALRFY